MRVSKRIVAYLGGSLAVASILVGCDSSSSKDSAKAKTEAEGASPKSGTSALDEIAAAYPVGTTAGCDVAALEAAAKTVGEQPIEARAKAAAEAIESACGDALDEAHETWFKHIDRAERPFIPALIATIDGLATAACPSLAEIRTTHATAAPGEQAKAVFEACGFAKHGVIEADQVTAFHGADPVAHAQFPWLTDHGVPGPAAASLVRALLTFETQHANPAVLGEDGSLATAATAAPVPACPIVRVTNRTIELGVEKLALVNEGVIDPSAVRGQIIVPLYDRLSSHPLQGGEDATLCIAIDPSLSFEVAVNVMYTGARTAFKHYGFIVSTEDEAQPFGALMVDPPFFARGGEDAPFGPSVRVTPEGFSMELAGDAGEPRYDAIGSGMDYEALKAKLTEIKGEVPDASIVTFAIDSKVPLSAFLKTLEVAPAVKLDARVEVGS